MKLTSISATFRFLVLPLFSGLALLAGGCATMGLQLPEGAAEKPMRTGEPSREIFALGGATYTNPEQAPVLDLLKNHLADADSTAVLLLTGDSVYPKGLPPGDEAGFEHGIAQLDAQLALAKNFKGKTIIIPGDRDWGSGLAGIHSIERHLRNYPTVRLLPDAGCGLSSVALDDATALIAIDSQWMLEDWDDYPAMNQDCTIKTREQFFEQLEAQLAQHESKTILLLMHHPLHSSGVYGGQFSLRQQLFPFDNSVPLPVVGTLLNMFRRGSGLHGQDLQNRNYGNMKRRIGTLLQDKKHLIVVSGHERNLQFSVKNGVRQLISGAGNSPTALSIRGKDYGFAGVGFAKLRLFKDGSATSAFYSPDSYAYRGFLTEFEALPKRTLPQTPKFNPDFSESKTTAVYSGKPAPRSAVYRFLWGDHYRDLYYRPIIAPTLNLETYKGGLQPEFTDADQQLRSLKFTDGYKRPYHITALKKSATRFLQSQAFKDHPVEEDFRDTYTEQFILDLYTTTYPFAALVADNLSKSARLGSAGAKLYYLPRQNRLGIFNSDFGDELVVVSGVATTQEPISPDAEIIETETLLARLQKDPSAKIDSKLYLKTRVFDMLIGDWDRGHENWKWLASAKRSETIYIPVPHHRQEALSKFDGALLSVLVNIPSLRHMKSIHRKNFSEKWFNREAYALDLALLPMAGIEDWTEAARAVQESLSDAEINNAFNVTGTDAKDAVSMELQSVLRQRRDLLGEYAKKYAKVLMRTAVWRGTEKRDRFDIVRNGKTTTVSHFVSDAEDNETLVKSMVFSYPQTREIWIYGLGEKDSYNVSGTKTRSSRLRLAGGAEQDRYAVSSPRKVHIYDFKGKTNDLLDAGRARLHISDDYARNTYHFQKPGYNVFAGYPLLGFNPDDGLKIGGVINYTVNGFRRDPYSQRHSVGANYYFATSGYELSYKGIFPKALAKWNLHVDGRFTSANFSQNFFGFGNETENEDGQRGMDFNRVKTTQLSIGPSFIRRGEDGTTAVVKAFFERIRPDATPGRYISVYEASNPGVFDYRNFADLSASYRFENYDNQTKPTLGATAGVLAGYKFDLNHFDRSYPYAEASLGVTYRIVPSGRLVFATLARTKWLFTDTFEFYQAATVGGDSDLRGYRNHRFAGRQSFYQSSDLRWDIGKLKTGVAPISYGVLAGFDYGRVWLPGETSKKWHHSTGVGVWLSSLNLVTGRLSYFMSGDGGRLFVGLGFGF